jgi:hypothetical protein
MPVVSRMRNLNEIGYIEMQPIKKRRGKRQDRQANEFTVNSRSSRPLENLVKDILPPGFPATCYATICCATTA